MEGPPGHVYTEVDNGVAAAAIEVEPANEDDAAGSVDTTVAADDDNETLADVELADVDAGE